MDQAPGIIYCHSSYFGQLSPAEMLPPVARLQPEWQAHLGHGWNTAGERLENGWNAAGRRLPAPSTSSFSLQHLCSRLSPLSRDSH